MNSSTVAKVPKAEHQELKAYCKEQGLTITEGYKRAIRLLLKRTPK